MTPQAKAQADEIVARFGATAIAAAAERLRVPVSYILAVTLIESRGDGMAKVRGTNRPKILFEAHLFRKFTGARYDATHAHLSSPYPQSRQYYSSDQTKEHGRFSEAFELNGEAAMKSASWGAFQIMGFNYALCGFDTVGAFVDAMRTGHAAHLGAFCSYLEKAGLVGFLRVADWAKFARGYNGPDYMSNRYDEKMRAAAAMFSEYSLAVPGA